MSQQPAIGRIVLYTLTEDDAKAINKRRDDFTEHRKHISYRDTGYISHFGNEAREGDVYPAVVIRVWPGDLINAKVLLDGTDTFWATSRHQGDENGNWNWPPRA